MTLVGGCLGEEPGLTSSGGTSGSSSMSGTSVSSTSVASSSTSSTTGTFMTRPDQGGALQCDIWTENCPRGEKCMPWANDGGSTWNATKCVPVVEDPKGAGEPCTVEENGVSGIDDCDLHHMCWDVDPETLMGTCVAMCTATDGTPTCEDPCTPCTVLIGSILGLCLPRCDPLLQDCPGGDPCIPKPGGDGFVCVLRGSPDAMYGEPCEYAHSCVPGLFCAVVEVVPGCEGSLGCCTEFCDLTHPDGDAQCAGFSEGQVCVPWSRTPPEGCEQYANVGACVLP